MHFKTKIDNILKAKGIALWKLSQIAGLNTTLERAYDQNREMRESTTLKLLENVRINPEWWKTGEGEIFLAEEEDEYVKVPRKLLSYYEDPEYVRVPRKVWEQLEATLVEHRGLLKEQTTTNGTLSSSLAQLANSVLGRVISKEAKSK